MVKLGWNPQRWRKGTISRGSRLWFGMAGLGVGLMGRGGSRLLGYWMGGGLDVKCATFMGRFATRYFFDLTTYPILC